MKLDELKAETDSAQPTIKLVHNPNLPVLYVNNANFASSAIEVRLTLLDTASIPGDDSGVIATEKLCLVMSPEFADILAKTLTKQMQAFEERFGKLRTPGLPASTEIPKS